MPWPWVVCHKQQHMVSNTVVYVYKLFVYNLEEKGINGNHDRHASTCEEELGKLTDVCTWCVMATLCDNTRHTQHVRNVDMQHSPLFRSPYTGKSKHITFTYPNSTEQFFNHTKVNM